MSAPALAVATTQVRRIRGRALQERNRRFQSEHPMCQLCRIRVGIEVDHVLPLWAGGLDEASNLQNLCVDCHKKKTASEATQRYGGGEIAARFSEVQETARPSFTDKIPPFSG